MYDGPGSLNGGDTGESTPATVTGLLVHAQLFPFGERSFPLRGRAGAGTQQVVRLVVAMGTLLGPEETNTHVGVPLWGAGGGFFRVIEPRFAPFVGWVGVGMAFARHDLDGIPQHVVGFGRGWWSGVVGWLWVGRWLRIAQWTRASLWSSCQGRMVDALAPGADEGRGRPR